MDIAVSFIFFNKVDTTKQVFLRIKEAKPDRLYLISDGGRNEKEKKVVDKIREWVEKTIDWKCTITRIYASENMGCKNRIVSGINEVFEHEESSIILEDDCLPQKEFFGYCKNMLEYYKDSPQVMMINGSNLVPRAKYEINGDYTFSANPWVWGWATWRRAWKLYDPNIAKWPEIKRSHIWDNAYNSRFRFKKEISKGFDFVYKHELDTWDYQWQFAIWINNGLCIVPRYNLINNLGFNIEEATHTSSEMPEYLKNVYMQKNKAMVFYPNKQYIVRDEKLDATFDAIIRKEYYSVKNVTNTVKKYSNSGFRKIGRIMRFLDAEDDNVE